NYNHRNSSAWLFEIGKVYLPVQGEPLPQEKKMLTIGMYGDCDFYDLKGVVENMFEAIGIRAYDIMPLQDNATFHPGQTAHISLRKRPAATIGRIHPTVQENYEIDAPSYVAVIDFDMVMECKNLKSKYKSLPKFPATSRDIAVLIEDSIPVRKIEDIISKTKTDIIEGYKFFDVYKGAQVKEGYKSVAYSISFRASDRTLTDTDVNEVMNKIMAELKQKLNAELRD
ncbi:MAG: phenylalanine--tRNA ligase subunit beta, partial [Eubacteriales bacterium]|nr:phenylalanine--tRNA ligase subunit beta [Eubacteriales bacterium]